MLVAPLYKGKPVAKGASIHDLLELGDGDSWTKDSRKGKQNVHVGYTQLSGVEAPESAGSEEVRVAFQGFSARDISEGQAL
jgi:hypothetical protein